MYLNYYDYYYSKAASHTTDNGTIFTDYFSKIYYIYKYADTIQLLVESNNDINKIMHYSYQIFSASR